MKNNNNATEQKIMEILQKEYPKGTSFYTSLSEVYKNDNFVLYLCDIIPKFSKLRVEDLTSTLKKYMEEE